MKSKVLICSILLVFILSLCCCSNLFYKETDADYDRIGTTDSNNTTNPNSIPSTPTGLYATIDSYGNIEITWNPVNDATGYKVYYANSSSTFDTYIYYTTNYSSCNDSITSGSRYFKVSAINSYGESDLSSYVYVTYPSSSSIPSTPTGLVATIDSYGNVILTWNEVSDAIGYIVYYADSPYSFDTENVWFSASYNYATDFITSGTRYYKVSAINNAGESALSSYDYVTYSYY